MTPNEYQTLAARTLIDKPDFEIPQNNLSLIWHAIRQATLTGDLADYLKKGIFHQHGFSHDELLKRLAQADTHLRAFGAINYAIPASDFRMMLFWNVIGLIGESGEIAALLTQYSSDADLDRARLIKELGDCLWYLTALCTKLDLALEDVMALNIEKLKARYPEGFSAEASRNRQT